MRKLALSHEKLKDAILQWTGALDKYLSVTRRAYSYMSEEEVDVDRAQIISTLIAEAQSVFEVQLSELPDVNLFEELEDAIATLEPTTELYKHFASQRTELIRLISEAKFSMSSVAIAD